MNPMYDTRWKSNLRRRLLKWFDENQRDLPWRACKSAYRVWVSEIMLQQTQVATVVEFYKRFLTQFPDVKTLAAAEQEDVLKLWEGLGYYRRARQLHAAAQVIVNEHGGNFPSDLESVLALPGIGRYTAGAILSISQEQKLPILEGNTIRLFARLMAMKGNPRTTANQKALWEFSESLLPDRRCGDLNQALMELGSEICQPTSPKCERCPLQRLCPTFGQGLQTEIPVPAKKMNYEDINEAVVIVCRRAKYLVRLCGEGERWTGLWDFPRFKTQTQNKESTLEIELNKLTGLSTKLRNTNETIKHAVTRFRITLDCFVADEICGSIKRTRQAEMKWRSSKELNQLPMSVTGRKIAKRLSKLQANP